MQSCLGVLSGKSNLMHPFPISLSGCLDGRRMLSSMLIRRAQELMDPNGPRLFFGVLCKPFKRMAGTTGLEPAASAVTAKSSTVTN
jgi:hypothetical protein